MATAQNKNIQKILEKKLLRAMTCLQKGELLQTSKDCHAILKLAPEQCDALHFLALVEKQKNNFPLAIKYFERAIASNPGQAGFYYNMAVTLQEMGLNEQAKATYLKTLSLQPGKAEAYDNLGILYQQSGDYELAADAHLKALETNPHLASAYNNLGEVFRKAGQVENAIVSYQKALGIEPNLLNSLSNLGNMYKEQGDMETAMAYLTRAIELDPSYAQAYYNLGNTLLGSEQHEQGIRQYRKAVDANSNYAEAHWNLALALLLQGRYQEGWYEYEWGFAQGERSVQDYPLPTWDGEDISNKTLLVLGEQGIGDEIMFASCIPDVINTARSCIIECDARLAPVFTRSFPGVRTLPRDKTNATSSLDDYPGADLQIPMGSLPHLFRNRPDDFPRQHAYLLADPAATQHWRDRLATLGDGLKVGISWRGGHKPETQQKRSTRLEQWRDLFAIEGVHFINLQYGDCTEELTAASHDLGVIINDWDDVDPLTDMDGFLAQVAALDLVITIDNSTAHVAGALGIPVWTLLPYIPDWRWKLDSLDTPWYASMTLLRQSKPHDWESIFAHAAEKLEKHLREPETEALTLETNNLQASSQQVLLLNDTSAWYHWGCTCTTNAILTQLRTMQFKTASIPINDIYACRGTPASVEEFDSEELRKAFFEKNERIIDAIARSDIIVINGEGTLHNLSGPALNLLYLAYIAKTVLGKPVHIINHSCYPEDLASVANANTPKNALYKKVYQVMDSIAVRETVSADLLESLQIPVNRSFDCLPLYLQDNNIQPVGKRNNSIVIAGSVSWATNKIPEITRYMQLMHDMGYKIMVLTGASAYPAKDDSEFITALSRHKIAPWEIIDAKSAAEWLGTIANADLLVSGRFHHSIAAAFLHTPFIALNSNTPKMNGLMQMLGLAPPINYSEGDLVDILYSRSKQLLDSPEQGVASNDTLESLALLAKNNFTNIVVNEIESAASEHHRRLRLLENGETDKVRWQNKKNLNPDWDRRAAIAATMIDENSTVLDLGCGAMSLEKVLPQGCNYLPCDVVARDSRTQVCDFNRGEYPDKNGATLITALGVLEYLNEPQSFFRHLRQYELPVVLSYCLHELSMGWDRPGLGMANHLNREELIGVIKQNGFMITAENAVDNRQVLFKLIPSQEQ